MNEYYNADTNWTNAIIKRIEAKPNDLKSPSFESQSRSKMRLKRLGERMDAETYRQLNKRVGRLLEILPVFKLIELVHLSNTFRPSEFFNPILNEPLVVRIVIHPSKRCAHKSLSTFLPCLALTCVETSFEVPKQSHRPQSNFKDGACRQRWRQRELRQAIVNGSGDEPWMFSRAATVTTRS